MSPFQFLSLGILLTAAAALSERILAKMHHRRLGVLAAEWKMNYSPVDPFRLTPRVARNFPVPGAANISVVDLIYGVDAGGYRYIFTAEYTAGVVTGKHRVLRAASLTEPRDRAEGRAQPPLALAPAGLPLLEQYRKLAPAEGKEVLSAE